MLFEVFQAIQWLTIEYSWKILFVLWPWGIFVHLFLSIVYVNLSYFYYYLMHQNYEKLFLLRVRRNLALMFKYFSDIFFGHEIVGLENLPEKGKSALIISHHTNYIYDILAVYAKCYLSRNRNLRIVVDRLWFKIIPGLNKTLSLMEASPGTIESCVKSLNDGNLLFILPGGGREGIFSFTNYEVIWAERKGFAKVAVEAKVPVIPMFTVNGHHMVYFPCFKRLLRRFYKLTGFPLPFCIGFFPVKLVTYIGKPIEYDPSRTVDELRDLTKLRIESMISKYQKVPKSYTEAILDRFRPINHQRD